ncbi:hypothetical protein PGIGA_G00232860 [Pangasianodon gigas]|uniref:Uncharacterized protein n=1 Tax=Pangasianodon gigas TaxID=30993 RepID=A0ACC5WL99_PANGG|nr:hypothetical protein [Pangasianodon gigas]
MSSMEKHLFNLKFAAKELERNAKKCDKDEKAEKAKVKKVRLFNSVLSHMVYVFPFPKLCQGYLKATICVKILTYSMLLCLLTYPMGRL